MTSNFNFVPNPMFFQKLFRIFGCLQTQTTCLRIEVKPERSRKLCHIFSHRTRHNEVKYFQKEHSCYHSPMFSFNWSKQWWVEEKTTLCNERQNEITMNWISMLRLVWHNKGMGRFDCWLFHRTSFLIAKLCDFFNLSSFTTTL